jgi:hypothetical protein
METKMFWTLVIISVAANQPANAARMGTATAIRTLQFASAAACDKAAAEIQQNLDILYVTAKCVAMQ